MKKIILVIFFLLTNSFAKNMENVKIGWFLGGRVNMLYRTSIFGDFDKENVNVDLYTKNLNDPQLYVFPKDHKETLKIAKKIGSGCTGKMSGIEIVDEMLKGNLDGGAIGESSFIFSINKNFPITAVAVLGHDVNEYPGKGIVIRKGLHIEKPEDFKGKVFESRRAGPGDAIFLREFLRSENILDKVKIIDQVNEDKMSKWLKNNVVDAGFCHLTTIINIEKKGIGKLYRPMNWMPAELSNAVLVFRNDFIKNKPDLVQKVIDAYIKRIKYEHNLPEDKLYKDVDRGMFMKMIYKGMSIPQYNEKPILKSSIYEKIQDLLLKYKYINKKVNIKKYIDNRFVEKAYNKINNKK